MVSNNVGESISFPFQHAYSRSFINAQQRTWTLLEFSELGFIGKLFKSSDLPRLSKFMLSFYEEQPIDWLLTYFRLASTQDTVILRKPTLFQHVGLKSSFDITSDNKLKDRFFDSGEKKWKSDDPPASVVTNMNHYLHWIPDLCYASGSGYFWAKDPKKENDINIIFAQPQQIKRIAVETGTSKHPEDTLLHGIVEISPKLLRRFKDPHTNLTNIACSDWRKVGEFKGGRVDTGELSTWYRPTECLRIVQTQEQEHWIIYHQVAVFTYPT